ncbi:MAG: hypothetical protein JWO50_511 [Candidatus Kaiserbacteria bacterium]|nr:hypothetical protein [Candidatus Kaiserbacteria bacterium]
MSYRTRYGSIRILQKGSLFSRFASIIVSATMLLSPFSALAQETPPTDTPSDTTTTAPTSDTTDSTDVPPSDSAASTPTDTTPPSSDNAASQPNLDAPTDESDVSSTAVSKKPISMTSSASIVANPSPQDTPYSNAMPRINVQKDKGSLSYGYDIKAPRGINGLTPDVSLGYLNNRRDEGSIVGFGWALSVPKISRVNKTGVENLYTSNTFTSSIDDELVQVGTSTKYVPRVDNGSYRYYVMATSSWTMYTKDGTVYTFGVLPESREASSTNIATWYVSTSTDSRGNAISYRYTNTNNIVYPDYITYATEGGAPGFKIQFTLQTRTDPITLYKNGFSQSITQRISQIDVYVGSAIRDSYLLGYTSGVNGVRSLLSSITEQATSKEGTVTTLPATFFAYNGALTWQAGTSAPYINIVYGQVFPSGLPGIQKFVDSNSDGINEIRAEYFSNTFTNYITYFDTETNTTKNANSFSGNSLSIGSTGNMNSFPGLGYTPSEGVADGSLIDTRGNFQPDYIHAQVIDASCTGTGTQHFNGGLFLNTGSSAVSNTSSPTSTSPILSLYSCNGGTIRGGGMWGDINGDGLLDVAQNNYNIVAGGFLGAYGIYPNSATYTNNSHGGFTYQSQWESPHLSGFYDPSGPVPYDTQLVDLNNDGLVDFYSINNTSSLNFSAYLNNGQGFSSASSSWNYATGGATSPFDDGVRMMDINGDDLPDIVRSYHVDHQYAGTFASTPPWVSGGSVNEVYVNTGDGFVASSSTVPVTFASYVGGSTSCPTCSYTWNNDFALNNYADTDGDGLVDLGTRSVPKKADMLAVITSTTGASTTISYTPTPQEIQSGAMLNPNLPIIIYTPTEIKTTDNSGVLSDTTYSYTNGLMYYASSTDKTFAGFKSVTETSGNHAITTYYSQGNTNDSSLGEQNDQYALIGKPYRQDVANLSGNILQKTWYRYVATQPNSNNYLVLPSDTIVQSFDVSSNHRERATHYVYDLSGNPVDVTDYGEVAAADSVMSSYSDTGSDLSRTHFEYATSTATSSVPNITTSYISRATQYNQAGIQISDTKHLYDNLAYGLVQRGNETQTPQWIFGSTYATSTQSYNAYGLIISKSDPKFSTTTIAYDSNNLYPATTTNALNQSTLYTYDVRFGLVIKSVDPNGLVASTSYDGLGRPLEIDGQDASSTIVKLLSYNYNDATSSLSMQKITWLNGALSIPVYSYKDGLGRTIQTATQAAVSQWIMQDTTYDSNGRVYRQSLPYFNSTSSKTAATSTAYLYSTTTYDALDRPATTTNAIGFSTILYGTWNSKVTDANGHIKDYIKDARGNLAQVVEHGTSIGTTTYEYDGKNNLATTTDAMGNIRHFTYDGLNRLTLSEDLHSATDTSFGSYSYAYDLANNLTSKITPNGLTISSTYDVLNRQLTEDATTTSNIDSTYTYDSCTNGIGRLCSASSTSAKITNSYYLPGFIASSTTTIKGINYLLSYLYDRQGNQISITYPDNSQVMYSYDDGGLISRVQHAEVGSALSDVISNISYAPINQPAIISYANGATTTKTYDPASLYRLTRIFTTASTTITTVSTSTLGTSTVNILVVGGGGGGGNVSGQGAGGGGAGGYQAYSSFILSPQTYTVTVGAGGSAGSNGGNSIFDSITAIGGGAGGFSNGGNGAAGGSGGGGGGAGSTGGAGTAGQGHFGGNNGSFSGGSSGGGATGVGTDSGSQNGATGAAGTASSISGTSVTYAGGGGGGGGAAPSSGPGGAGGAGGGGAGGVGGFGGYGIAGTANTGGGGGGGGATNANPGGAGGSGIVVISYPTANASLFTCSASTTTSGSNSICKFTSSGTFRMATTTATTTIVTTYIGAPLQDLNYTYDAVGNITRFLDNSITGTAKDVAYTYDNLNRLTQAQITTATSTAGSWYNSSWNYRIPINASSTKVSEDTHDVYLDLSLLPSTFQSNVKSDGCDIRMTKSDGTTELAIDLVRYGSGTGELHFSTGNGLSTSTATTYYLYYGNGGASCYAANATYGAQNVYDTNTKGVWHLQENTSAIGGVKDSTVNSHNATMYSNYSAFAIGTSTGKLGSAVTFDGIDDTIDVPDSSDFEANAMTIESWAYFNSLPGTRGETADLVAKKHASSPWSSYASYVSSPTNRVDGSWADASGTTAYAGTSAGGGVATSTWTYAVLRHDPGTTTAELQVRANASSANTYTANTTGTTFNSNDVLRFGADYAGGNRLSGRLDEIRIHNIALSDNYLLTRYNNMNSPSNFWSVGSSTPYSATTSSVYTETYTYNLIGNILNKSNVGDYTYAGTGYANPHAATAISGTSYAYDHNGNLTSQGTKSYAWDFKNQLTQSVIGGATTTYGYDTNMNRAFQTTGSTTTTYPSMYFSSTYATSSTSTSTKNIFVNGVLLATVNSTSATSSGTGTTTTYTLYSDSLSSGWDDWSFGTTNDFAATTTVYSGSNSLKAIYTGAWGGVYLHNTGISTASSTALHFAVFSPVASPYLQVLAYGAGGGVLGTAAISGYIAGGSISANTWYSVDIPLTALSATSTTVTGFAFQKDTAGTIYYDDIKLINGSSTASSVVTTTLSYIHPDLLGSTNVVTDATANVIQTLDYYPYGGVRINTGTDITARKYIGQYQDATSLDYLNARYYDSSRGQFLSEDPVFWDKQQLDDPQSLNSYSYANNNPVLLRDPSGRTPKWLNDSVNIYTFGTMDAATDIWASNASVGDKVSAGFLLGNVALENTLLLGITALSFGGASALVPEVAANGASSRAQLQSIRMSVQEEVNSLPSPATVASRINSGEVELSSGLYSRPSNATTPAMRQGVNYPNVTCSTCGKSGVQMYADHTPSLVTEYYTTGKIDYSALRLSASVRPQCASCSVQQGALLSSWSKQIKNNINK